MARTLQLRHLADVIIVIIACGVACTSADVPYMSQFPSEADPLDPSSPMAGGGGFQFLHVRFIRQHQASDARVVSVGVDTVNGASPRAVWVVNGQHVAETDAQFPQTTSRVGGFSVSISLPHSAPVTSLRLHLSLEAIETSTVIRLQDLDVGRTIVELGMDAALALSRQEVVAVPSPTLDIITRFFAEDLPRGTYEGLQVYLVRRENVYTPEMNPGVLTLRRSVNESEVPLSLRARFDSPLSSYAMLTVNEIPQSDDILMITAEYENNIPCRLFGGQSITRRIFLNHAA